MNFNEGVKLRGEWTIFVRNVETGKTRTYSVKNTLTKIYQSEIIKLLNGTANSTIEIKYIALGTGSTPATSDDTKLQAEIFRRQPTLKQIGTGVFTTMLVLNPADAVGHLREIGVFFGTDATETADTGKLLSRIVIDLEKTSSEEIIFQRKDYIII